MAAQENDLMESRYGHKPKRSRRYWVLISAVGIALMALGALFAAMANFNPVQTKDIGFSVKDATQVVLDFEISKPKNATAICSLESLNEQFSQVGYKEIEIGPQDTDTVRFSISINTTELATTALVDECRLK
jgi:Domain of unknown function (DUF4307)